MTTIGRTPVLMNLNEAIKTAPPSKPFGWIGPSRAQPVTKDVYFDELPAPGKKVVEEVRQGRRESGVLLWGRLILVLNHHPHGEPDADGKRKGYVVRVVPIPVPDAPAAPVAPPAAAPPTPPPRAGWVLPRVAGAILMAVVTFGLILFAAGDLPARAASPPADDRIDRLEARVQALEARLP